MKRDPNLFNFFIPIEFKKGGDSKTPMRIKGIMSTGHKDSQEETLLPEGFIFDRFLKSGFVNYNHLAKNDPKYIIGEPTIAKNSKGQGVYLEADLYDTPLARSIYDLGETLAKNNSNRRLGFSIEGKALERDPLNPKIVTKTLLTGVAVTPTPINTNTYLDICKGEYSELYQEYEFDLEKAEFILDVVTNDGRRIMINKNMDIQVEKAEPIRDDFESDEEFEKAMSCYKEKAMTTESASAVKKESLDNTLTNLSGDTMKKAIKVIFEGIEKGITTKDDIQKAIDYIEKAEGSRGGHVIGHTKSGKPIYTQKDGYHRGVDPHSDFTTEDHKDAIRKHKDLAFEALDKDDYKSAENHLWASKHHAERLGRGYTDNGKVTNHENVAEKIHNNIKDQRRKAISTADIAEHGGLKLEPGSDSDQKIKEHFKELRSK